MDTPASGTSNRRPRWLWWLVGGTVLMIVLVLLAPPGGRDRRAEKAGDAAQGTDVDGRSGDQARQFVGPKSSSGAASTPEEIVAEKVSQFGRSRREICFGLARKHQVEVPAEVERFFDAMEAGNWSEIEALFNSIKAKHQGEPKVAGIEAVWPAVLDTFGAAQQAHLWPAQKLLDYGNAVLGALRPDMVYVGGTDPGRWIPALMNASDGERRVVITQNALGDQKYLEYVQFVYGERIAALTSGDAAAAQQAYLQDARKRWEHDQQFPNEPKQLRPGEDVRLSNGKLDHDASAVGAAASHWSGARFTDGTVEALGRVSLMAINEKLLQALLDKNPNFSFALEESFPFASINADAAPLGPILELRAEGDGFTRERATASLDYWRAQMRELMSDPAFTESDTARKSYSKLVSSQGGLLEQHKFPAEAEAAYQFANELCPSSPEAVFRYINLLVQQQRTEDAMRVANNALIHDPQNQQFKDVATELGKMRKRMEP